MSGMPEGMKREAAERGDAMNNEYLEHHGIKGMKWGVRRYQNEDGSYTKAGLKRRQYEESRSDDRKQYDSLKKKKVHEMSNKELSDYNNRANLEYNYQQNRSRASKIRRGIAVAATVIGVAELALRAHGATTRLISVGKETSNKLFDSVGDWVMNDFNKRH